MGGSSSKDLGRPIGTWASGKVIYENKDGKHIVDGISKSKYREVINGVPEAGHEIAFYKYISPGNPAAGQVAYSQQINAFKQMWLKNKTDMIQKVAAASGVAVDQVSDIAAIALPILLESGQLAARKAVQSRSPQAAKLLDQLIAQVSAARIQYDAGLPAPIVNGAGEMRRHYSGSGEFYNHMSDAA